MVTRQTAGFSTAVSQPFVERFPKGGGVMGLSWQQGPTITGSNRLVSRALSAAQETVVFV
jgi:hypothetical protein